MSNQPSTVPGMTKRLRSVWADKGVVEIRTSHIDHPDGDTVVEARAEGVKVDARIVRGGGE